MDEGASKPRLIDGCVQCRQYEPEGERNGVTIVLLTDVAGLPGIGDFPLELARHGYQIMVIDVFRGQPWVDNGKEDYETWRAHAWQHR